MGPHPVDQDHHHAPLISSPSLCLFCHTPVHPPTLAVSVSVILSLPLQVWVQVRVQARVQAQVLELVLELELAALALCSSLLVMVSPFFVQGRGQALALVL